MLIKETKFACGTVVTCKKTRANGSPETFKVQADGLDVCYRATFNTEHKALSHFESLVEGFNNGSVKTSIE